MTTEDLQKIKTNALEELVEYAPEGISIKAENLESLRRVFNEVADGFEEIGYKAASEQMRDNATLLSLLHTKWTLLGDKPLTPSEDMKRVKVPSFECDHTTLKAGLYLREIKHINESVKIFIWDLRFVAPSDHKPLSAGAMHSIEHIMALKLRAVIPDSYIGFYTYGCQTGFALCTKDNIKIKELAYALIQVIEETGAITCKEEIPCLTEKECGNPSLYSIADTNIALMNYLKVLKQIVD